MAREHTVHGHSWASLCSPWLDVKAEVASRESLPRRTLASGVDAVVRLASAPRRRITVALLAARLVSAVSTLVVLVVLARTRGIDALGIGSLGVVTGTILAALAESGTNSLAIREVARAQGGSSGFLGSIIVYRAAMLPIVILVSVPLFSMAFGSVGLLVLLFALSFMIQQVAEFARSVLLAVGRPYVVAAHVIVENVAWGAAIIGALAAGADLYAAAALGLTAMVLSTLTGACLVLRCGVRPSRPTLVDFRLSARLALPFAACSLVTMAALRLDTVLVSLLVPSGITVAGAYFAATRLIASAEYIPEAMGRAVYPELARRAVQSPGQVADVMRPAIRDLLSLSIPIPVALVIGGSAVLPIVFGSELAGYAWILTVLGFGVPARFAVVLFGLWLSSADAQGRRAAITAVALVVGQGLDLLLLPLVGVQAAVLASIVTTLLLLIPYVREIRGRFGVPVKMADVIAPLACACLAAIPAVGCRVLLGGGDATLVIASMLSVYCLAYVGAMLGLARARNAMPRREKGEAS